MMVILTKSILSNFSFSSKYDFSDSYAELYPWAYMGKGSAATTMLTKEEIAGKQVKQHLV
jgi:hypothetical protein